MLAFTNSDDKKSPTIIGAGCTVNGDIRIKYHSVQVHGTVIGNIKADTVIIGRGGKVVGKVVATNLFLHGDINGPAIVDTAHIFKNATMTGKLFFHKINITGNEFLDCHLCKRKEHDNETKQ